MSQVYASGNVNGAVIIAPESSITSDQLKDLVENGPKNELYLQPNQTVVFSLNQEAQIGLKGVNGEASYTVEKATISGTGTVSTTDMFYRISSGKEIKITNTSETNILKCKYNTSYIHYFSLHIMDNNFHHPLYNNTPFPSTWNCRYQVTRYIL